MAVTHLVNSRLVACVLLLIAGAFMFFAPLTVHGADCPPKDKNGDGKATIPESAGDMCMKGGQPGVCDASGTCTLKGGGPMPMSGMGMPPMLPMLPMPPMGGGGGGMPPDMPTDPPFQDPCSQGGSASSSPNCPSSSGGGFSFPSIDTSGDNGSGGIDIISSLLNGTISADDGIGASTVTPSGDSPVSGTTGAQRPPFGSTYGFFGDAQLRGNSFTLLVSNRDISRNTQVSGFYGFTTRNNTTPTTLFQAMCTIRPWSSGFISFILSPIYFDSLCWERGYASGQSSVGTASTGFAPGGLSGTTNTTNQTSSFGVSARDLGGSAPEPPKNLGPVKADIWASPPTVSSGSRTSVFWQSTGVSSCSITSNENNFSGSSLSGHSITPILTKDTTFTISCLSAASSVSNKVVVTVQ